MKIKLFSNRPISIEPTYTFIISENTLTIPDCLTSGICLLSYLKRKSTVQPPLHHNHNINHHRRRRHRRRIRRHYHHRHHHRRHPVFSHHQLPNAFANS